jgi:hypothetical protein
MLSIKNIKFLSVYDKMADFASQNANFYLFTIKWLILHRKMQILAPKKAIYLLRG